MGIEYSDVTRAVVRLRCSDCDDTVALTSEDLVWILGKFNSDKLTSGKPFAYLCFFQPELFITLETDYTVYEFQFCLDCEAVKIIHRGEALEHSDFRHISPFINSLAQRYFGYVVAPTADAVSGASSFIHPVEAKNH